MDLHLSAKSWTPAPGGAVLREGRRFTLLGLGLAWRGLAWPGLCSARLAELPVRVLSAGVKAKVRVAIGSCFISALRGGAALGAPRFYGPAAKNRCAA